jgi:hypothetical protein
VLHYGCAVVESGWEWVVAGLCVGVAEVD